MSAPIQRPLAGLCVGLSISGDHDLTKKYGLSEPDISAITVELCRRLVGLGAQVALGHQWRPKGIMEEVVRFARAYQWEVPSRKDPIIHNFLAWPDRAALSDYDRKELSGLVAIDEAAAPPEYAGLTKRAAALTEMRARMNSKCHARICLSGKATQPDKELVSGVLEEASDMIKRKRPVFLSGMMGGTALLLINSLRYGKRDIDAFGGHAKRTFELLEPFSEGRFRQFAKLSGLTKEEQDELFDAQNLDTIIELTARGLCKVKKFLVEREEVA
jgi:hypothetical protein